MNYDNGQIRGQMARMPGNYPNTTRPPSIPSGYPSHALPGNNVRYAGNYPQPQPQMGYMPQGPPAPPYPYPNEMDSAKYYPGDENQAYSQQQPQFCQGPPHEQVYYQHPHQQHQGYHQQYPMRQQYPPSLGPPPHQQGFQQPPMMDPNSQYAYGPPDQYYQGQPPPYPQRFQGPPQQCHQYQHVQHPMIHSNNMNQRPLPPQQPYMRPVGPPHGPPVRTGFRNPGPYFSRPVRPPPPPPGGFPQSQSNPDWNYQNNPPPVNPESAQSKENQNVTVSSTANPEVMVSNVSSSIPNDPSVVSTTTTPSASECEVTPSVTSKSSSNPDPGPSRENVQVPWGWKRTSLSDQIVYHSPSGIELKTKEDIKEYLLKEGTCKCGLECPLEIETTFDFDASKIPVMAPIPEHPPNPAKYCSHKVAIANLARSINNPGFGMQIKHLHDPLTGKKGGKKKNPRKKRPYSGVLTQQMIEAREAEKQRINEIISQQKKEYEAQMSLSIGSKKSAPIVMKPLEVKEIEAAKEQPNETSTPPPKLEAEVPTLSIPEPPEEINAKNIEIRRISATEEGDKVLESAWDSPEKEQKEGKTPLQMVQSIVSKLEDKKAIKPKSPPPQPPVWTQGSQRPLLHSQKQVANETPPSSRPLPTLLPPQALQPQLIQTKPSQKSPPQTVVMAPTAAPQFIPVSNSGQQVMQLVNTINGPLLMQTIATPVQPQPVQVQDKSNNGKGLKKATGPPVVSTYPSANPVPILVSPPTMMTGAGQPSPNQHVLISSHPSPGSNIIQGPPQIVLNQPVIAPNQVFLSANGTLVAMPTAPAVQGVVYNQLPDGTLVQVQGPTMIPAAQPSAPFVINSAGQQVSPNRVQFQAAANPGPAPGTFIMTPAGLVQTVQAPGVVPISDAQVTPQASPVIEQLQPQPGPSSSTNIRKESTEESDDDDDDDDSDEGSKITQNSVKFVPTDEDEEEEESSDGEEMPLAQKKSPLTYSPKNKGGRAKSSSGSPKISIQSNKVDSSGLQATPPHPNEESESSLNKLSSPEAGNRGFDSLDTSGSTDGSGPSSSTKSPLKRRRKRNAEELIKQDLASSLKSDDSEEDEPEETSSPKPLKQFNVGELVWGPHGTFPSWPGKLVRFERDGSKVLVCWFGNRDTSQVNPHYLKSLSDGLEAHHRERKKLRKGRKMNASLEKAIQEAMMELDRMADD